jgi:hypothetical protein
MPALYASVTAGALANGDAKLPDERPHDRQIFLMLRGVVSQPDRAATRRTRTRQRRLVPLVDVSRRWPMGFPSIGATRLPARSFRLRPQRPARERRRLPMQRAAGLVEVLFEPIDFLPERVALASIPIAIPIRPLVLATQTLNFTLLPLEFGDQFFTGGGVPSRVHAPVMARLSKRYKYDFLDPANGKLI